MIQHEAQVKGAGSPPARTKVIQYLFCLQEYSLDLRLDSAGVSPAGRPSVSVD